MLAQGSEIGHICILEIIMQHNVGSRLNMIRDFDQMTTYFTPCGRRFYPIHGSRLFSMCSQFYNLLNASVDTLPY